ncbi:leucine-rich repeat domain-containing protein [Nodosilinea sp. LEGE 07088]|uniref:COR domain-containing protein n=1 Tax=Nodosilinea sp. LEGE 07088 TaxID=2777968 RepID=UPI0018805D14|nr:COR domain-containing protein [Nodosilinea sp. LEGE 07088]MBE9140793.1 leucine-rich repeat domain-containing protein [Nodosilinea sp. LEGE 07088]
MSSQSRSFLASPEGLKRLQAAKAERGWTFAAIAERAGVSADTVSRLFHPERGKRVSQASVAAITQTLELEPDGIGQAGEWTKPLAEAERRIQEAIESSATELNLSGLELTSVPEKMDQLTQLTHLFLHQNQLTMVPKELGHLVNLTHLFLHQNQLTEAPKELGRLGNLTQLHLHQNHLTTVPKELGDLTNLIILDLSRNSLTAVPKELGSLTNLTHLYLHQNYLTAVPKELGDLASLIELFLHKNQLTAIPDSLGQLANLTALYLGQNQLTGIPDSLGQLNHMTTLDLSQNQLTAISDSLGQLNHMTELYLDQNQLTAIPVFVEKLARLERLDITHSGLSALPEFLLRLPRLKTLLLHGNEKLGLSDEILGPTDEAVNNGATAANPQDILNYYFRVLAQHTPLNEAKLILVGFGAVGKTSLVNRLIHKNFDAKSPKTEGIQITPWEMRLNDAEDIKLHVWDFGGQEIMHSTHQFFLTERSLYLLVLNGRQGHEDADAEYWLELIQSFGGDSPVIVVLNKIKEHPFDVNRGALQQKFPNVREFIATDCETGQGIDHLRTAIDRETDALEHLRDPFPASWVAIKDKLAEMADNYISFEQYRAICQTDGETDFGAQDSLAVHLHSLGIALNYKDDPRLRDTHVLNPHWVTNGIYTLLNAEELAHSKGELEAACLSRRLDAQAYPAERHGFLLELMRKFELCFRYEDDENRYLIPDLLDKQQPAAAAEFDPANCLNFRYEYPILPEGLLPRFIVRTHVLSEHQLRWRTGVILNFEGNRALVKADPQDRCVSISVAGPMTSRRRLLAVIRSDFERIHRSFKFKPKELVPVPGHPDVTVDYKELLAREDHRQTSFDVFTGDGLLTLTVRDLLNGVDLEGTRQPAMERHSQALRLFYSYSHKDETLRDELETHLKLLQRQGLIQPWHDRRILPGNEWGHDIDDNLNRADIILLLVSADFIASDYCYDIEMTRAMERHENGEAHVIPIILRSVDLQGTRFQKLAWLPTDGEPVTQWRDRDAAWYNVETGIKRVVEAKSGLKRF